MEDELNIGIPELEEGFLDASEITEEDVELGAVDELDSITDPEDVEEPTGEDQEDSMSPTELLAHFGIEGEFKYGDEMVTYDGLSEKDKVDVLQQLLHKQASTPVEQDHGLADEELELVNFMRKNNVSFEDMVNARAEELAQSFSQSAPRGFGDLAAEDMFRYDFMVKAGIEDISELTAEGRDEMESLLEAAQSGKSFEKRMEALKGDYLKEESRVDELRQQQEYNQYLKEKQASDAEFVKVVASIDEVGGVEVNDDEKNFVLGKILEVDEKGNPLFYNELFSDPKLAFKAVYAAYFGEQNLNLAYNQFQDDLKKSTSNAKKEVLEGAGYPKRPIQQVGSSQKTKQPTKYSSGVRNMEHIPTTDILHNTI